MSGTQALPVQNTADIVGLPLADNQLEGIAQSHQPALAAQRAHLPDVVHVHDRVAVNSLGTVVPLGDPRSRAGSGSPGAVASR